MHRMRDRPVGANAMATTVVDIVKKIDAHQAQQHGPDIDRNSADGKTLREQKHGQHQGVDQRK